MVMGASKESHEWIFPSFRAFVSAPKTQSPSTTHKINSDTFDTPSTQSNYITWQVEHQLRISTCDFIKDLGNISNLPLIVITVAQQSFHRFYMLHSFESYDRFLIATAAVFVAAKSEEFGRKLRVLTEEALYLLHVDNAMAKRKPNSDNDTRSIVESANERTKQEEMNEHVDRLHALMEVIDVGYVDKVSQKIVLYERVLLFALSFEIGIHHPFQNVHALLDAVFGLPGMSSIAMYEEACDMSFIFLCDAMKHGLGLGFDNLELAAGAVYLALLYITEGSIHVRTRNDAAWWSVLSLEKHDLIGSVLRICVSIFALLLRLFCVAVARGILWMYQNVNREPLQGLGRLFKQLWTCYIPNYIK